MDAERNRNPAGPAQEKEHFSQDALYPDGISPARRALDRRIAGGIDAVARIANDHWLFVFNLVNIAVFVTAFAVPLMMHLGLDVLANPLFAAYRIICVQDPDHSYFILGYQMAMDQRMTAIFGSAALAGLFFGLVRRRAIPLSWRLYLLLILPMAVDGFTQLFGWRDSNWELRTLTGGLFGVATIWLAYPYLEASARKTRESWSESN